MRAKCAGHNDYIFFHIHCKTYFRFFFLWFTQTMKIFLQQTFSDQWYYSHLSVYLSHPYIFFTLEYNWRTWKIPVQLGQLENMETRTETRMETGTRTKMYGTPKTDVKILDWAAHHYTIILSSSRTPRESGYARLGCSSCPSRTD